MPKLLSLLFTWQPIAHYPRKPWLACWDCGCSSLNESNRLRRGGWQESVGLPRCYRCGECAEAADA